MIDLDVIESKPVRRKTRLNCLFVQFIVVSRLTVNRQRTLEQMSSLNI